MSKAELVCLLLGVLPIALTLGTAAMKQIDPVLNAAIIRLLLQVLFDFGVEPKDAMDRFGYDKSQWSRMCSGDRPAPSITRITVALSFDQLYAFIPEWSKLVARHKLLGVEEGATSLRRSA